MVEKKRCNEADPGVVILMTVSITPGLAYIHQNPFDNYMYVYLEIDNTRHQRQLGRLSMPKFDKSVFWQADFR